MKKSTDTYFQAYHTVSGRSSQLYFHLVSQEFQKWLAFVFNVTFLCFMNTYVGYTEMIFLVFLSQLIEKRFKGLKMKYCVITDRIIPKMRQLD